MNKEKKQLMYIHSEDFYFLTYNTFVLLNVLDCVNEKRFLKDYRKLAYLIEFVSNPYYASFLTKERLGENNLRELRDLYSNAFVREKEISRLLFALEQQGVVKLKKKEGAEIIDVTLMKGEIPSDFLDKELFQVEIRNTQLIKENVPRLTSIKLESVIGKIFTDKGFEPWQLF